jgi:hypothetical protein
MIKLNLTRTDGAEVMIFLNRNQDVTLIEKDKETTIKYGYKQEVIVTDSLNEIQYEIFKQNEILDTK